MHNRQSFDKHILAEGKHKPSRLLTSDMMSNVFVPVGKAAWECKPETPSSRELTKDAKLWAQQGAQYSPPLLQVITYRGASVPHRNSHMY